MGKKKPYFCINRNMHILYILQMMSLYVYKELQYVAHNRCGLDRCLFILRWGMDLYVSSAPVYCDVKVSVSIFNK